MQVSFTIPRPLSSLFLYSFPLIGGLFGVGVAFMVDNFINAFTSSENTKKYRDGNAERYNGNNGGMQAVDICLDFGGSVWHAVKTGFIGFICGMMFGTYLALKFDS